MPEICFGRCEIELSVVIASFNRRDALARCMATLCHQDLPPHRYEIVVVVDGSTDGTATMLRAFNDRRVFVVIGTENKGQTAALNAGVGAASGEIVLFLDDDLLCDRGLLSAHLVAHKGQPRRLVFGRMRACVADGLMHEEFEKYYSRLEADPRPRWPDEAWAGPNCSLPRNAFMAVGGYDEKHFPRRGEDVDLGLRLWDSGLEFHFAPQAITSHRLEKSVAQMRKDTEEDGASMVRLYRRHPKMRPLSPLAGAMNAAAWKRFAARMLLGMPFGWHAENIAMLAGASREAGSWDALTRLFRNPVAVLLYHHIGYPTRQTEHLSLTVTPEKFARQMRWLQWRGYTAITPAQWLAWRTSGTALPAKAVMLTFDDAYADIAKHALPVLERFGFSSAVFVISGQGGGMNAWDGLPLMTIGEIRHWAARGVEIGAHSRTHPELTAVATDLMDHEVTGSKEDLIAAGLSPVSFAYPYGEFNDRVRNSVEKSFSLAFTCEEGLNDLRTDPLLLRRTMVQPGDTIADIELRAAFGWSALNSVRSRLRVRSRFLKVLRMLKLVPQ